MSFNRVCGCGCSRCASGCAQCDTHQSSCQTAAEDAGCPEAITATFTGTTGMAGGGTHISQCNVWSQYVPDQTDPQPCAPQECRYFMNDYFWEHEVSITLQVRPHEDVGSLQQIDWEASGFTRWCPESWDDCDCDDDPYYGNYIKLLGTTTATCCDHPRHTCAELNAGDFDVAIFMFAVDPQNDAVSRLYCTTTIDTDSYPAFTVSHDGTTGSPTDVTLDATASTYTITFTGGDYDGLQCTIPAENEIAIPVACGNFLGKGITVTANATGMIGGCHPIQDTDLPISILGTSHTLTYKKTNGTYYYTMGVGFMPLPEYDDRYDEYMEIVDGGCNNTATVGFVECMTGFSFSTNEVEINVCGCGVVPSLDICPEIQSWTQYLPIEDNNPAACSGDDGFTQYGYGINWS